MGRRQAELLVLLVVSALLAAACTTTSAGERLVVDVFGPYRGDDARAFAASVAPFEERTGIEIRFVGSGSFARDIQDRVADADYPDVAIFPQPAIIREFARDGILIPLSDVDVDEDAPRVSRTGDATPTVLGRDYGVWYRAAVKSLVWYPPTVFAERGYEIPESWEDLVALTERIESDGLTPWCLTMESFASTGWVGTDWIEDIVLRLHGPDVYDDWVDGIVSFKSDEIMEAFDIFGEVVNERGRVLGGAHRVLNTRWQDAQIPMFEPEPKCLLHRQASFYRTHLPGSAVIGEDTDVFLLPAPDGGEPPIVVSGDIAAAFTDRPEVLAFLQFLGSPEAGTPWAKLGGFTSPHPDFDTSVYADGFDRRMGEIIENAAVIRFDGSDSMDPAVGTGTFWTGMETFVRTADVVRTVTEIQSGYPQPALLPTEGSAP
ncbi:MAG: ABC transporter substrate-binding protein [Actinomycetota bacterium]